MSYQQSTTERIIQSFYHGKCADCGCPTRPGDRIRYTPKDERRGRLRAVVKHAEGQCPPVADYTVQLLYRATSKRLHVRALSAEEAIHKAMPKRIPVWTDSPCGYVVWQGNVEITRRIA